MGFSSRCLITGDPSQSDLQRNEPSGLWHAVNHLQKLPEIGFSFFTTKDVVRNSLLEKIILAYTQKDDSSFKDNTPNT
jgi:phosphate starvation-inducible PhoH-like protein